MKPSLAYATLIGARADGLRFAVLPNGSTLAARGARRSIEHWAPVLREHKPGLLILLLAGA